jgi:hypothetical protein
MFRTEKLQSLKFEKHCWGGLASERRKQKKVCECKDKTMLCEKEKEERR